MRISRSIATLSFAAVALAGLSACSSDDDTPKDTATVEATTPAPEESETATDEATDEPSDEATTDDATDGSASAGSGDSPDWAVPTTTPGEKIATAEGTNFTVDIYQVATAPASKNGMFVDPETNLPLIAEGDELVYVNYVFTNTSSETIPLTFSLVSVKPEYADWKWMQGMDSITDSAQYKEMDVTSSAIAPGSGEAPFAWAPGQTFSSGTNFKYQAGSPITFTATLIPADENGDLVHDQRQEVKVDATIS